MSHRGVLNSWVETLDLKAEREAVPALNTSCEVKCDFYSSRSEKNLTLLRRFKTFIYLLNIDFFFFAPYWVSTDSHAEDMFRQPFENIPHVFVQASAHMQRAAG